jgi:hypothetical protein
MNPILGLFFASIVCAGMCFVIAKKRGSNVSYWVVMALLVGPFALPFVFFSKPKNISAANV